MHSEKFTELIIKYIHKSINKEELDLFHSYLENPTFDKIFKSYIETNFIIDLKYNDFNTLEAKKELLQTISNEKIIPLYKRRIIKYGIVATIAILISMPFIFNQKDVSKIEIGTDKAILTLENGNQIALEKGSKYATNKVTSDGESLVYQKNKAVKTKKISYNYLTIPRGGQFFVILSDGTEVWLNSASKLKYPVTFLEGKTREVELIYGEAFFDVSKSSKHQGASFHVKTAGQIVSVLGTKFNIKAYKMDSYISTTLVEGKVAISNALFNKILRPGQQSRISGKDNEITVSAVDVTNEIAWKNGFFSFEEETLEEIFKTLARWYDVTVVFEKNNLRNIQFSGILKRTDKIEELLVNIEKTGRVKFDITNAKITVK
ncbi:MAG: FecR family protein [Polaribacter sp.]